MTMTILPLATVTQFKSWGGVDQLIQDENRWDDAALATLMVDATTMLQDRANTRLTPFSAKVETFQAYGVSPDEYGQQGDMPMDLTGALGWSQASALGVSSMVREFWLRCTAVAYPEWWNYSLTSVKIVRTFGDSQLFESPADFAQWQGPDPDTGHVKMPIGTYCPVGSTIIATYGGGYNPIPGSLKIACIFQAMKLVIMGAQPAVRKDAAYSLDELDAEIVLNLGAYARDF
jgi:hypothetical protein